MPSAQKTKVSKSDSPRRISAQVGSRLSQTAEYHLRYMPAVLMHNAMGWFVEYYVLNPDSDRMERKRMKLNMLRKRYARQSEFKVAANEIVCDINAKLAGGWTPFGENESSRYYTQMSEVLQLYIEDRARELKKETMRSYRSFANIFGKWLQAKVPNCKCIFFNRLLAVSYMDDYYRTHPNTTTYNNMLKMTRAFFAWAKDKCYIKENHFELIKTKKRQEKKRILIPLEQRRQIREYYEHVRPEMVMVCELVYSSLIRPIEITRLKVGMLHLKEMYIEMPAAITKTGYSRNAVLSKDLCLRLASHVARSKSSDYVFGSDWLPDAAPISDKAFRKNWTKMRNAIGLPEEMQLYSLRDTGIFDKIKSGIDPLTVMQAADHHDLQMTTRYANHVDPNMVRIIAEKSPDF